MPEILFICEHSPFKFQSGVHQRTNLLCTAFSKIAHVDVLTLEQDKESNIENCAKIDIKECINRNKQKKILLHFCLLVIPPILIEIIKIFKKFTTGIIGNKKYWLAKIVRKQQKIKKYDLIFVRGINNLLVFGIKPSKIVIIDIDDLPEQTYQSKLFFKIENNSIKSIFYKLYYSMCAKICRYYTKKIVKNVSIVYLPNESQCSLFENAVYLPNIPYKFAAKNDIMEHSEYQIMFVGVIEYKPNYMGIEYFLENIYPSIIDRIPQVNFNIIGRISEERKEEWLLRYKNISLLGVIDDLKKEYEKNSVIVVPIYNGAGTNIKVLEAMSMEKACVTSTFAGKGFEKILENGKNIIMADSAENFAEKIIELLKDKDYRDSIAKSAKEAVDKQYSFECFSEIIINSMQNSKKP